MMKKICNIYKSAREEELYIYVDNKDALSRVPDALKAHTGELKLVMTLLITEGKNLARVEAVKVLNAIEEQGFYLQMPPTKDPYVTHYHGRENR
jgi:uncharacterized protein YcgL (UPF0745 family)